MNKLFCFMLALVFTTGFANATIVDGANSNHNLYTHTQTYPKPKSTFIAFGNNLSANTFLQLEFVPYTNKFAAVYCCLII